MIPLLLLIMIPETICFLPTELIPTDDLRLVTHSTSTRQVHCAEPLPATRPRGEEHYNSSEVFYVKSLENCVKYCMYSTPCWAIAYSANNSTCVLLYTGYVYSKNRHEFDIFVRKSCILAANSAERLGFERLYESELSELGVEIVGMASRQCLKFRNTVPTGRANVFWTNCPAFGRWKFQSSDSPPNIDPPHHMSYIISTYSRPDMCLEFLDDTGDVFLSECRDSVLQMFSMINNGFYLRQFRLTGYSPTTGVGSSLYKVPHIVLKAVNFPIFYLLKGKEKPIPLENLSRPHSTLLNPERRPFILPGTPITIDCNDGHHIPGVYETSQELVLTERYQPLPCVPIPKKKEPPNSDIELETRGVVKFLVTFLLFLNRFIL